MLATARDYERLVDGAVRIEWVARSLKEFGMTSVESLAREFDLIVLDHPHIGVVAESGCVVAFDDVVDAGELALLGADSPGHSHESYRHGGRQWALAIDAACQSSAWRPDLIEEVPRTWDDVVALSRSGKVCWPLCDVDAAASLMTLAASAGAPCATSEDRFVDREVGEWALATMRAVARASDPVCRTLNPIGALEAMSRSGAFVYSPLLFCYVNYSRADAPGASIRYGNVPALAANVDAKGALLGGAGLAVSALRGESREAVDYALYVASPSVQAGSYFSSGGQPAHHAAWSDPALDVRSGGFFSGLEPAMAGSFTRPRGPRFAAFQNEMIRHFTDWFESSERPGQFLDTLDALFRNSLAGAMGPR